MITSKNNLSPLLQNLFLRQFNFSQGKESQFSL